MLSKRPSSPWSQQPPDAHHPLSATALVDCIRDNDSTRAPDDPSRAAATAATAAPMSTAPIGERIDEAYVDLSPQEQRAADFILAHLADLAVYNATELARLSGVSKATVSRLFRRLGFSDAKEVRAHARILRAEGVPLGGASAALTAHLAQEQSNIHHAFSSANVEQLTRAAALIAAARRVVVIGLRNSYPVALHLRQQLLQGLADVRLAPQPGQSIGEELAGLGPTDVAIVIGFRRRPDGFARILDAAHSARVPIVLLADPSARRFSDRASAWLECPVDSVSALDSYAAANSLVSVLASQTLAVAARTSRTRIASINRLYSDLHELESPSG
ncbi:MurR/RpiR family transcriptional regulator [Subtercola vilae]|nr:MurR/RpiR family transcriptional regulator [Subtercola vilae]